MSRELPWTGVTSSLARAMRAGLARADMAASTITGGSGGIMESSPRTRGIVTGGFSFDPEELHEYAAAMGQAYTRALAEELAAQVVGSSDDLEDVADKIASGLEKAGGPGLFAGLFAQGVITGELEHREQLKDDRREQRDQEGQDS